MDQLISSLEVLYTPDSSTVNTLEKLLSGGGHRLQIAERVCRLLQYGEAYVRQEMHAYEEGRIFVPKAS